MSSSVAASLRKAERLARQGKLELAKAEYEEILQAYPQNESAKQGLEALLKGNTSSTANSATQKQLAALINLYNQGKLDEALQSAQLLEHQLPDNPQLLNLLGVICSRKGLLDKAIDSYKRALAVAPNYAEVHNNLGNALRRLNRFDAAIESFEKALLINPAYAEAHNNLGNALLDVRNIEGAIASFHKAKALNANFVEALINLGNSLREAGRVEEAIPNYRRALRLLPNNASLLSNLGSALLDLDQLGEAAECFKQALAIEPGFAEAHSNLGVLLMDSGKLDEATTCFRTAIRLKPEYTKASRYLSFTRKFSEHDDDIRTMEKTYLRKDLNDEQRMHLAFALGKAHEDLRGYEQSFRFYLQGNSLKRNSLSYSIDTQRQIVANLKDIFSKELFDSFAAAGSTDETPIFILGMPRSGTTLVEQILASHKDVSGGGELGHLADIVSQHFAGIEDVRLKADITRSTPDDFTNIGEEYIRKLKQGFNSTKFVTDKMPFNFHLVGLIWLLLPNAKVVHCQRDPRATCFSIFKNYFNTLGNQYAYDLKELGEYYNLYQSLMNHWHSVLPGFIYDIRYEDLISSQEDQTRSLLEFCRLDWDAACLQFHETDRLVKTASAVQVRKPVYSSSIELWRHYEEWLSPLLEVLSLE